MTRRLFVGAAAAGVALGAARSRMGIATTSFAHRKPKDTLEFLRYCARLGAGGIQAPLTSLDPAYVRSVRRVSAELGMYFEVMLPLPAGESDPFERSLIAAREAGATAIRSACLHGRRYENFATLADWKEFVERSRDSVLRATTIVERHKMPLGVENHKDWTSEELSKMMKQISSEYVGVCLDTGNNISLLEDPMAVIETLAPYAMAVHLKDMAMGEWMNGFELSEVPFGDGLLNLPKVVAAIGAARPKVRITLEMITRDPLKVPCLMTKYWTTFPDRSGYELVRTLQLARSQKKALPRPSRLDAAAQLKCEEENVLRCLDYGRRELGL